MQVMKSYFSFSFFTFFLTDDGNKQSQDSRIKSSS
jgi:hypothetical protein